MNSIASQILYEDNHLIVLNKQAGQIVQGDKTGDVPLNELLKNFIKGRDNKPGNVYVGTVHRLDRPTSGIVIFAKTSKALTRLNKMLQEGSIHKSYWAITENKPLVLQDTLIHFLKKNPEKNKSFASNTEKKGYKKAVLTYNYLKSSDNFHLLEIQLLTGRHHQIRCQLLQIDCIIKGDLKYGAKRNNKDKSISLHSRKINFVHPVNKQEINITAPVPEDALWQFFEKNERDKRQE